MKKIFTLLSFTLIGAVAFSQGSTQEFTTSGAFTVPPNSTLLKIEVVGAGGTGGGNGGGGGGGGGFASGTYAVTPGDVITVVVGTGGAGAAAGTSSVGTFLSATGGENGTSVPNPNLGGGGAGGTGSGGTIVNNTGGTGGGGYWTYFGGGGGGAAGSLNNGGDGGNTIVWNGSNCFTPGGEGGTGGGNPGGDGGKGAGFTDNFCNVTDPAVAGANFGGGGGGANGNGGAAAAGANGYCLISWGVGTYSQDVLLKPGAIIFPTLFVNKINTGNSNGNELYELSNSIGQVIWKGKNIQQQDFSYLASGFYLLKINTENTVQSLRLMKQ